MQHSSLTLKASSHRVLEGHAQEPAREPAKPNGHLDDTTDCPALTQQRAWALRPDSSLTSPFV